ncbi:hypothetical protein [Ottowia thiooxydans]|uniref:Uncharacterized protein n=1 Tax=Ottowia thiooxydans TaxID=219182 RepID=A0ABV2Q6T8_9BURK
MTFGHWHAVSANPLVPLAIPVAQGGQYRVPQAGVDAAHLLSRQSGISREALYQTLDREAFANMRQNLMKIALAQAEDIYGAQHAQEIFEAAVDAVGQESPEC